MKKSPYRWAVVGMLWLICLFNYADRQAIFSVFERLKAEMDLSDVQLGVVGGAFMWVYAAALPFAGVVADRTNRSSWSARPAVCGICSTGQAFDPRPPPDPGPLDGGVKEDPSRASQSAGRVPARMVPVDVEVDDRPRLSKAAVNGRRRRDGERLGAREHDRLG